MAAVTICSDIGVQKKTKSDTVSTVFPSISHEVMGPDAMILVLAEDIKKRWQEYTEELYKKRCSRPR